MASNLRLCCDVWWKEKEEGWKEQDVRRMREGEMETEATKGCNKRKREKLRGQRDLKTRKWKGNDIATFLGLNLPADCCCLHFPLPGCHGGKLWHGCPWGVRGEAKSHRRKHTSVQPVPMSKDTQKQDSTAACWPLIIPHQASTLRTKTHRSR